jgi:4-diphosphocytidyl-2-C-methyl-D-erythritol kinase
MSYLKIKSYAKVNLALNITGKSSLLHKIESIITFLDLHDLILIKKTLNKNHQVRFNGIFSKKIKRNNTVSKLLNNLDKKNLLKNIKLEIIIQKNIPSEAGLGGGSMNAASILKFLIKRKIIKISKKETIEIANKVGSDVVLGMYSNNLVLKSNNKIEEFSKLKNLYVLLVKPNFGCSTKVIYSKVKNFKKGEFNKVSKNMFKLTSLKRMSNDLELIACSRYPKLNNLKIYLEKLSNVKFVRMTGSGSVLIAYFSSNKSCEAAKQKVRKQFRNYWCKTAKTI